MDFDDGRCAGTGLAMGITLYDRTVNLDNVMGDPQIIYSTALLSYFYTTHSQALSLSLKKIACYDRIWNSKTVFCYRIWRDLSSQRSESFAQFIRLHLPQDAVAFIAFICHFPKHMKSYFSLRGCELQRQWLFWLKMYFHFFICLQKILESTTSPRREQSNQFNNLINENFHFWQVK